MYYFLEADAADLFGDADDISSEEEKDKAGSDREDDVPRGEGYEDPDRGRRSRSLEEEPEQEPMIQDVCI